MQIKRGKNSNNEYSRKDLQYPINMSIFARDYMTSFAYKKTERLTSAIHMVTNFVPENEPLRIRLRNVSLRLLSDVISFGTVQHLSKSKTAIGHNLIESAISTIAEIVALLEISFASGYISEMNFTILRKEYLELAHILRTREKEIATKGTQLSGSFFDISEQYIAESKTSKRSYTDTSKTPSRLKRHPGLIYSKKDITTATAYKNRSGHRSVDVRHNRRKSTILELLKKKPQLTVKDVAEVITDCSEKTLQRELLTLVHQNVLKKEGERRWSRYSLV